MTYLPYGVPLVGDPFTAQSQHGACPAACSVHALPACFASSSFSSLSAFPRSIGTSLRRDCSSTARTCGRRACGGRCCRPTWQPAYQRLLLCRCERRGEQGHGRSAWCGGGGVGGAAGTVSTQPHCLHMCMFLPFDVPSTQIAACSRRQHGISLIPAAAAASQPCR